MAEIRITTGFFAVLALGWAWGAGEVLPHVLLSALCHELGHLGALAVFGVRPERITLTAMGAEITAPGQDRLSYGRELLAVLAGAGVNMVLALIFARLSRDYLFAGANAILAAYNLLPIRGLDGSRALYLLLAWFTDPFTAERLTSGVNLVVLALFAAFSALLLARTGGGIFCCAGAAGLVLGQVIRRIRREKPYCKTAGKTVQ